MSDEVEQTWTFTIDGKSVKVDRYFFGKDEHGAPQFEVHAAVLNAKGDVEGFEKFDFDYDPESAAQSVIATARFDRWESIKDVSFQVMELATQYGVIAIKSAILINGAAAIALLAFIGQQWQTGAGLETDLKPLLGALSHLVTGVFSAALSAVFSYISVVMTTASIALQVRAGLGASTRIDKFRLGFLGMAMISGAYSYVRFGIAIHVAGNVLTGTYTAPSEPSAWSIFFVGAFAVVVTVIAIWAAIRK